MPVKDNILTNRRLCEKMDHWWSDQWEKWNV